jgi:GT2 family glycosyltransferase
VFPTFNNLLSMTVGLSAILPSIFPGLEMKRWDHLSSRRVDHVIGAFYLVRRSVFEALGGLDERFFVYFEDLDFSLRAAQAGWESHYLTTTSAYHEAGGSSKRIKATRLHYVCRSRVQLAWKHLAPAQAMAVTAAVLVVEPWARLAQAILARERGGMRDVLAGTSRIWMAFAGSPKAFVGLAKGEAIGDGT